jgi:hypothetical protein
MNVLGRGIVPMSELHVGDMVLTHHHQYEKVYAYAHFDKVRLAEYLQIHHTHNNSSNESQSPLEVSKDHLLLVNNQYLPASAVQVGDNLRNIDGIRSVVSKITSTQKNGLYAPLTPSGTIIVNGVQASSYVSLGSGTNGNVVIGNGIDTHLSYHKLNHMALSPIRIACIGISSQLCHEDSINQDTGYPAYVSFWFQLVEMFQNQVTVSQILLLGGFFAALGPFYAIESFFGARLALVVALALGLGTVMARKKRGIVSTVKATQF